MIGIVITGHGQFASGIQSAVRMMSGEKPQIVCVDFTESMSADDLRLMLHKAAGQVDSGEGILFLSDIPGGSPFQQSAAIAANLKLSDVLSGTNLIMAAEACIEREFCDFGALIDKITSRGQENIKSASIELRKQRTTQYEDGGI